MRCAQQSNILSGQTRGVLHLHSLRRAGRFTNCDLRDDLLAAAPTPAIVAQEVRAILAAHACAVIAQSSGVLLSPVSTRLDHLQGGPFDLIVSCTHLRRGRNRSLLFFHLAHCSGKLRSDKHHGRWDYRKLRCGQSEAHAAQSTDREAASKALPRKNVAERLVRTYKQVLRFRTVSPARHS
jgi:hypothetical protein